MFKKEPEALFHIGSTTICRLNKMVLFTKQQQSQLLSYKLVPISHIQGFRDMIKHLFHSISSYMNYSQLGTAHLVGYMYQLMYDSISWNNCFIQTERQMQKLSGIAKVMKLSLSSRVSIIL